MWVREGSLRPKDVERVGAVGICGCGTGVANRLIHGRDATIYGDQFVLDIAEVAVFEVFVGCAWEGKEGGVKSERLGVH